MYDYKGEAEGRIELPYTDLQCAPVRIIHNM